MAESPESPSRYSLPPEEKPAKVKKQPTRKRKAPTSEKITQAEPPGKLKIDFLIILKMIHFLIHFFNTF